MRITVEVKLKIPPEVVDRLDLVPVRPGTSYDQLLLEMIDYGVTTTVLAFEEDEMTKPKKTSHRYRVEPDGAGSTGRRRWSVVDSRSERKVHPGVSLGKAHTVADRLNREEARTP